MFRTACAKAQEKEEVAYALRDCGMLLLVVTHGVPKLMWTETPKTRGALPKIALYP